MFLATLIIRSISATFTEADLPHCDKTEIVDHYQSKIIQKRLWNNYTYCIKTVAANGYDGTDLALVFNEIGDAKVSMYLKGINQDTYTLYEMPKNRNAGAYFHKNSGLITFSSDKDLLISVGFTTFQGSCEKRLITNDYSFSRKVKSDTKKVYCIFNALPGTQRYKLYSNSSYIDFNALLYPRYPEYRDVYWHEYDFLLDQSSAIFIQYYVSHYYKKATAYIEISGKRYFKYNCYEWVNDLSEPQFLMPHTDLGISAGAIIGIILGTVAAIVGIIFLAVFLNANPSVRRSLISWFFASCHCDCEKPTGFDTIVEYSYSE